MEAMIQQLRDEAIKQIERVESLEAEVKRCIKEGTEESFARVMQIESTKHYEYQRMTDLKQALFYLRRAAGHEDVNTFNPERF